MYDVPANPVITLVTPSFNQAQFLRQSIESVLSQNYPALEYIVMDGGSDDGSVEIIRSYETKISHWVSDKDSGQADALNKGFQVSTGEVLGFLNSDDVLSPGTLQFVARQFAQEPNLHWLVGRCRTFGKVGDDQESSDQTITPRVPRKLSDILTLQTLMPQPSIFWRRSLWQTVGQFDESLHYCFDHEYWVRALIKGFAPRPVEEILAGYRMHGESKTCSDWGSFMEEFRVIAKRYENDLATKRELFRTRNYWRRRDFVHRLQLGLSRNSRIERAHIALDALSKFPRGIKTRAFWGYLAKLPDVTDCEQD
jgi:glycosyltransferase involved in cell wall biosynthesis